MAANPDLTSQAKSLARLLFRMMRTYKRTWFHWGKVAQEHSGSLVKAFELRSLAELPAYSAWFRLHGNGVTLTEEGRCIAQEPEEGFLRDIIDAVRAYARRIPKAVTFVRHLQFVAHTGINKRAVYAATLEIHDTPWPSEAPVTLRLVNREVFGKILHHTIEEQVIYLLLDDDLRDDETDGTLEIDRAFILSMLAEALETLPGFPARAKELWNSTGDGRVIAHDDSRSVAEELANTPVPWSKMLWGPPGGGKTYCMAHLVSRLLRNNNGGQVLVVAPSNRAVDVFVDQLVTRLEVEGLKQLVDNRQIVRYGYSRLPSVLKKNELLGPVGMDQLTRRVRDAGHELNEARKANAADKQLAVLHARLLAAQEELREAMNSHLDQCRVVATTTTLTYMRNSPIANRTWETVIVDEVTMIYPAMCVYLGSLAQGRFLLGGDPRQLGPIVEMREANISDPVEKWLARDMFSATGLVKDFEPTANGALARITAQRRCAPAIWRRVEKLYPRVRVATNPALIKNLAALPPCPGHAVVLLDTSKTQGKCQRHGESWRCLDTARLAWEVATTLAAEGRGELRISLIAPYRAQVRLLRDLLRCEEEAEIGPIGRRATVDAGTVHEFQGGQAEVVIFDLVDGPGKSRPGPLLLGDTGQRLVNVAITRARGKVIVIANREWWSKMNLGLHNPILNFLLFGESYPQPKSPPSAPVRLPVDDPPGDSKARSHSEGPESPIEERLLGAMQKHEDLASVCCQYRISDENEKIVSRADFAFPQWKLAVYCDGKEWHLREGRWQRDIRQRNELTKLGWRFLVFTGAEIMKDVNKCVRMIRDTVLANVNKGTT